jgi:hypothetical protein
MTNRNGAVFSIDFEWWRDDAGYRYVPAAPGNPEPSEMSPLYQIIAPLIRSGGRPARIVPCGGKLVPYRPFDKPIGLYRLFANWVRTGERLLDFVNRYGPLTADGNRETGEETIFALTAASSMRDILAYSVDERAAYFSHFGDEGLAWSRIDVALAFNPTTSKPQFRLTPPMLVNALWLELGQAVSSDASIKNCLHCGGWFEAGPGTGRREDAKFCLDAHRIAYNSRRRGRGKPGHA